MAAMNDAVLRLLADPPRSSRVGLWMSDCSFTQHVFEYPPEWL